jgi:hypothetical protein
MTFSDYVVGGGFVALIILVLWAAIAPPKEKDMAK